VTPEEIISAVALPTDRASMGRMFRALAREILRLRAEVEQMEATMKPIIDMRAVVWQDTLVNESGFDVVPRWRIEVLREGEDWKEIEVVRDTEGE
jgi:hypothetical protein